MPEPLLYAKVMLVAAATSGMILLAMMAAGAHRRGWMTAACVVGIGGGLVAGYVVLSLPVKWPPVNALDRFLTVVAPMVLVVEWIAGWSRVPRWFIWTMRLVLAALIPRALLHGSVYLSGIDDDWPPAQVMMALLFCSVCLAAVWSLLAWLSRRSPGASISWSLCIATLAAGMVVMLAGYIRGGAAVLPWVAGLSVATLLIALTKADSAAPVILAMGVVGLFGTLFIGRFFGDIPTARALAIFFAPLLCWVTEIPRLTNRNPWLLGSLRLVLVAIPLAIVLGLAKGDFDREMAPLLTYSDSARSSELTSCPRPVFIARLPEPGAARMPAVRDVDAQPV